MSCSSLEACSAVDFTRFRSRGAWLTRLGAVLFACGSLGAGGAQALTISSTVLEDNGATHNTVDANQSVYSAPTAGPGILTTTGGYNFTSTSFAALTSITSITVTLTMQDGNSGNVVGSNPPTPDFDFGHLRLALAGSDTGLILNGFRGNGLQDTFSFTGTPNNAAAILASLKSTGRLVGTVTTDNANDTLTSPNEIYFGNDQANAVTTLSITGVPEPKAWASVGLGVLALLGLQRRRASRQS